MRRNKMEESIESMGCVIVIDEALPSGVAANAAAIIGITLGRRFPKAVGADVTDGGGTAHSGIIQIPVPVLKADADTLRSLREKALGSEGAVCAADFSDIAQHCRTYAEYTEKASKAAARDFSYLALALFGPLKQIRKLTGSLPLLR